MNNIVLLSAGHYPAARGACHPPTGSNRFCEHDEALRWVDLIDSRLRERLPVVRVPTGKLEDKIAWMNAYKPPVDHRVALSAEIHFNSNDRLRGTGAETLYYPGSVRGRKAAELVQANLSIIYRDRGVLEGWYRQDKPGRIDYIGDVEGDEKLLAFLASVPFPAIIIEPEFIFNREVIEATRDEACDLIAQAMIEFCTT